MRRDSITLRRVFQNLANVASCLDRDRIGLIKLTHIPVQLAQREHLASKVFRRLASPVAAEFKGPGDVEPGIRSVELNTPSRVEEMKPITSREKGSSQRWVLSRSKEPQRHVPRDTHEICLRDLACRCCRTEPVQLRGVKRGSLVDDQPCGHCVMDLLV